MLNAMTVDLEDWGQAVLGPDEPITNHVVGNVERLLEFLDRHSVRATFFALGKVCEKFPELLPKVAAAGHEIASHGYGHELLFHLTPQQLETDVKRSIEIIDAQIGQRPLGYRAPAFSITENTRWAGPILSRLGFVYSSSIFPIRKKRYGIATAPKTPHRWDDCDLIEFPMTTLRLAGRNWPVCGGGYTRLLPGCFHEQAVRRLNAQGQPAVVYLHPYELAVGEVGAFRRSGFRMSRKQHLTQALWRSRVAPRLAWLFKQFRFAPMQDVLGIEHPVDTQPADQTCVQHVPLDRKPEPICV